MDREIVVRNNAESGSYEAVLDDEVVGMIVYERRDHRVVVHHTIVDPAYRQRGIATRLVRAALDDLIAQRLTLTNYCGFIGAFITANPSYAQVVDQHQPGHVRPYAARRVDERLGQRLA
jgi:predicted GNAT family acetyltransferase